MAGLLMRERKGPIGIGLESTLLLMMYAGAVMLQVIVLNG